MESKESGFFKDPFDWWEFQYQVTTNTRYCYSKKTQEFLDTVVAVATSKIKSYDPGHEFFRARIGHQDQKTKRGIVLPKKSFTGNEINVPPLSKRTEGRANPLGIGYLYLATDKETAIAETKPYKGAYISCACFKAEKKLNLVDFSSEMFEKFALPADLSYSYSHLFKVNPGQVTKIIWGQINFAFAKPIAPQDSHIEYIPTQIVAEFLNKNGFDGIIYNSSVTFSDGDNVMLFNPLLATEKAGSAELLQINSIELKIGPYEWSNKKRIENIMKGMNNG